jgi:predicted RNA binding protein YcfA (HicA-like mRNA interferase family)
MSVNRRDVIRHFEKNGFFLRREGSKHSIYSNGAGKNIPIKRHSVFDRITANELCKQAGIEPIF